MSETAAPEISRHKCLIYDGDPSEQLPVVVPLLIEGLLGRRRCLYLGGPAMVDMIEAALKAKGVDVASLKERGALILTSDRSHLDGGIFDPRAMVAMLRDLVQKAVADGYQGLCATGDMLWELGTDKNFEKLLEYEALLEEAFRDLPLMGICQYRRDVVPPRAIADALMTHRSAYVGMDLNADNLFYIPPELVLASPGREARNAQGEWMCRQIVRIQQAERKRDLASAALRESEAEARRLSDRLSEANADLERRVRERTAELEAANRELEAFSYSVSHDLRAPLRHILGFVEMLGQEANEGLGDRGRTCLARISGAAGRMAALIEDLLAFSRVAKVELRKVRVPLAPLLEEARSELAPEAEGRRIHWKIDPLPEAEGDPALLKLVLVNLLGNALKFTRGRSPAVIEVGAEARPGQVVVHIRDNGAGFDPRYAQKLFGVFQRLHRAEEFEGTGIGLANVQRVIRRHGGEVWAEGRPGEGAVFHFSLPD